MSGVPIRCRPQGIPVNGASSCRTVILATEDQRGSAPCQDRPLVGEREAGVRFRLAADLPGAGGGVLARTAVMRLVAPFRRCSARAYHRRWPAHAASEG